MKKYQKDPCGAGLLAREVNQADGEPVFTYFLVGDNENVVALADDNGDVTDRYDYSVFGTLQSHTGSDSNRIMFSSEPNDEDSGLIYLRHRYYEPESGRFVSRDADYKVNKQLFASCRNNPVYFTDPMGMREVAYGPNGSRIEWVFTNYPLDEICNTKYSNTINEALSRFYERKYYKINFSGKLTPQKNIICSIWSSEFIDINYKENSKNIRLLQNLTGAKKVMPFRVNRNPDALGHAYVYLKFEFSDGHVEWWVTETNYPRDITYLLYEGRYRSYRVKEPDFYGDFR